MVPEGGRGPGGGRGESPTAGFQLAAEIFELLRGDAAFEEGAGVDAGRGVPLEVDRVALELGRASAEEMVEADFVEGRGACVGGDVAADIVLDAVGAHDHGERVPADEAFDAALQFLIARE